ncbi:hypothetical protein ACFL0D_06920 [Thermoproteota archaeon]
MRFYKVSSGSYDILVCARNTAQAAEKFICEVIRVNNSDEVTLGRIVSVYLNDFAEYAPGNTHFVTAFLLEEHGYTLKEVV